MKKVYQSIYGNPDRPGDCLAACIATILELELEDVPHFIETHGDEWFEALSKWLAREHGLAPVCLDTNGEEGFDRNLSVGPAPFIAMVPCATTAHGISRHAVVAMVEGGRWRLLHDPQSGERTIEAAVAALFLVAPAFVVERSVDRPMLDVPIVLLELELEEIEAALSSGDLDADDLASVREEHEQVWAALRLLKAEAGG